MPMSPRLLRPRASGVHPEAADWRNRVLSNGGTVSGSALNAVGNFCRSIDAANLRSLMYRVNLFCGDNLNAALVPLYRGPSRTGTQLGSATDTNNNFISGDYTLAGGLNPGTGNTNKYLATGLANTAIRSLGNGGMFVNLLSDTSTANRLVMGQRQSGRIVEMVASASPSAAASYVFTAAGPSFPSVAAASRVIPGRYLGVTTATNNHKMYVGGVESGSNTTTETVVPSDTTDFFIFTSANGAAATPTGQYLQSRLGYYGISQGMTASQAAALDAACAAYISAIGRT